MAGNNSLGRAKDIKNDEFYTQYEDIQAELNHYEKHFKGKTVLCNCDDPFESNFCKFFLKNFNYLGLKRLICTSYATSPVIGKQMTIFDLMDEPLQQGNGYVMDISEIPMKNGRGISDDDIERLLKSKKRGVKKLKGDGDFRSEECLAYLKQSDIVVTNPPFSLFREFVAQLIEYNIFFIIIGNLNALHYKDIFPLIKDNKMWLGNGFTNGNAYFKLPDRSKTSYANGVYDESTGLVKFRNCCWFTNLDIKKRHEKLVMFKYYSEEEYPKYFNYDGIDVSKVSEIPVDYFGKMGVPDSFLEVYNPDQFEIIGVGTDVPKTLDHISYKDKNLITYEKDGEIIWSTEYSISERKTGNSLRLNENGKPGKLPYSRIIIQRKD